MKQGWEIKKLGEVCDFYRGLTYSKKDEVEISSTGVLRSNNIDLANNQLNLEEIKYISDSIIVPKDKKIKKGSLLICTANGSKSHLGKVALIDEDYNYAFGGFMGLMVPHKQIMTPKYFYYSLITSDYKNYIKKLSDGANINNLKFKDLQLFEIPVPSLLEQGRIVGVLDAAFAKIDALKGNAQKNLENAKALFQQVLKQELTPKPNWQTKKLSEVCETITDFVAAGSFAALRENVKYNSEKDFAQLVRTTDIKSNFTKGKFVYVSKSAFDFLYRVNLDKQSIVLPNVGVNCGEVYIVNPSQLPYEHNVLGPNAILVRSDTESNEFLSYAFKGQEFQKSLLGIINSMAQPKFNKTSLKKLLVCLPDKAEQNLIVKKLHSVEQMCSQIEANAEKTIAECDALKQAVLRRAFNGEL